MKKENLINWKDVRRKMFSQDELGKLDLEAKEQMVLREIKELRKK